MISDLLFWIFAAASVVAAWRVFRADSMVRAAFWLLGSFAGVAVILVLLDARFLGLVLILMMAGEMTIMAVFMVMFMMNPAGLNPMNMVHQHRLAIVAGVSSFAGLAAVGMFGEFPARPFPGDPTGVTAALGFELLGDSMLVFETAGVTLLATMIGAIAISSRRGRFGAADEGSAAPASPGSEHPHADEKDGGHGGHHGGHGGHHGGHGGQADHAGHDGHGSGHDGHDGHGGHARGHE